MNRKRSDRSRVFNMLDSRAAPGELDGLAFVIQPNIDHVAWKALEYYAVITPNVAQRQALLVWLREHPDPAAPVVEQMELEL